MTTPPNGLADRIAGARSWLFTPGTRADRLPRALLSGADALIVDLEDAVAPADKDAARKITLDFFSDAPGEPNRPNSQDSSRDAEGVLRGIRLNAPATRAGLADLAALIGSAARPDFVLLPKVEDGATIDLVADLLSESGLAGPGSAAAGWDGCAVVALVESARALLRIDDLLGGRHRPAALLFGAADMAADLGARPGWDALSSTRGTLIRHARAAGVPVIDSPYFDLADEDGLRAETARVADWGFGAKAAIHPRQIPVINDVFTPTDGERDWARRVLDANQAGVGTVDGQMVDEAIARRARRILARAPRPDLARP